MTDTATTNNKNNDKNNETAARQCNAWVQDALTSNRAIQFLLKTLNDLGCTPPPGFISCRHCEQAQASGFGKVVVAGAAKSNNENENSDYNTDDRTAEHCVTVIRDFQSALDLQQQKQQEQEQEQQLGQGGGSTTSPSQSPLVKLQPEIFVCQQYMDNKLMTQKTIVHELIHAIDLCRTTMDPVNNCLQLACTEIRAENLSGECSFLKELPRILTQRGSSGFRGHGAACIQRRAVLSVRANPKCAARAEEYVQAAMPRCLLDNYPFARHPNQRIWITDKVE